MSTVKHEGHTITLTDDLDFKVTGPAFDSGEDRDTYESVRLAKAAINDAIQLMNKVKLKARTTKIQVLDETGQSATITGINRTSRQLTGLTRDTMDHVYPNVTWIRTALQELDKIEADVRSRKMQLRSFAIDAKRGYGRITANEYDNIISKLEGEVAEKTKKAEKGPPELKPVSRGTARYW